MGKGYRTALGKVIDMDNIRLANEDVIAIGNMKVNARGDELGAGGEVVKTRNQVMDEYYRLNTPTVVDSMPEPDNRPAKEMPTIMDAPDAAQPISPATAAKLKGNLANTFSRKES
jgi:hypothetical protein